MEQLYQLILQVFPEMPEVFFISIKEIIKKAIFANSGVTLFNLALLIFSLVSFLNSIWNGLYIITDNSLAQSWKKHLVSLWIILFSFILFSVLNIIPMILGVISNIITDNFIVEKIGEFFPRAYAMFLSIATYEGVHPDFIFIPFLLFLFTFLYRWFFNNSISLKSSFWGAFIFVALLNLGKHAFLIYMSSMRSGIVNSYGDYYTLFVGAMWIYFSMCFFYLGCSVCYSLKVRYSR